MGSLRRADAGATCADCDNVDNVPVATLLLGTARVETDGVGIIPVGNALVTYRYATPPVPVSQIGACAVWTGAPTGTADYTVADADLGDITITGGSYGTNLFTRIHDPVTPRYVSSLDPSRPPFADGDNLAFDASGGADFPPTHLTMKMPLELDLEPIPYIWGRDYSVVWKPGTSASSITITVTTLSKTDDEVRAVCTTSDNGSFVLPAAVTSRLIRSDLAKSAVLRIERTVTQRQMPSGANVIFE